MAEIYRVEKGSEEWKYKAYDYVRTDAFCCGQNIPIELEFGQDESKDDLQAILLTEDHKPVAGCRIAFPAEKTGKIERVCVVREKQKSGYGRVLIEAAEKWLKEYGVDHIVITSQDRAAGFYEKLGYKLNPDADLSVYDHHAPKKDEEPKKPKKNIGFTCVLVENTCKRGKKSWNRQDGTAFGPAGDSSWPALAPRWGWGTSGCFHPGCPPTAGPPS